MSRMPLSDLLRAGYSFLAFVGDRTERMNSIVEVLPLSFGPWNTVIPSSTR